MAFSFRSVELYSCFPPVSVFTWKICSFNVFLYLPLLAKYVSTHQNHLKDDQRRVRCRVHQASGCFLPASSRASCLRVFFPAINALRPLRVVTASKTEVSRINGTKGLSVISCSACNKLRTTSRIEIFGQRFLYSLIVLCSKDGLEG